MAVYRADPKDGVAWVTGASTGIGRQLAMALASEGFTVAVTARDEERLATLAAAGAARGGRIVALPCDVTDEEAMGRTVAEIEQTLGPIVLAVFNAGSYLPTRGERLDVLNLVRTFEINLFGTFYGLVPTVAYMQARGHGHVVVLGSATAYFGVPSAGAYAASKAALNSFAESMRYDFDKLNIRIQVVNPGFVDTPMTENQTFRMPALISADDAARRIVAGLKRGGFEIHFPRRLSWLMKLLRVLPGPLRFHFINLRTGWARRPLQKGRKPKSYAPRTDASEEADQGRSGGASVENR